ncbi:hypothetical protein R1sor_000295 [Riccia sorocarpa]|uniref:Protein kinase domain-containing protein n=1 Tax=Riccia sorocarpa TaxID=122646 RepID=A0ABD3GSY6_9MARC
MAGAAEFRLEILSFAVCFLIASATGVQFLPLPSSQILGLLQLQNVLESPPALNGWYTWSDFCDLTPSPNLNIVCLNGTLMELRIVGDKPGPSAVQEYNNNGTTGSRLSASFSSDTLAEALMLLPNLTVLELVSLGMWGPLPSNLDSLDKLRVLNFSSNYFSGDVPLSFSNLESLEVVALDNNVLNGTFPEWLGSLPNLNSLILSKNFFTGHLEGFNTSTFQNLGTLLVDGNMFNGSVPGEIALLPNLVTVYLAQNELTGPIPDLSGLRMLEWLNLNGNSLGPDIPSLPDSLVVLELSRNELTGPIPEYVLTNFTNLRLLDLSFNSLSGFPPLNLFTLPNIETIMLSENHLSGRLPDSLIVSPGLVYLDISSNFFTGPLPSVLEQAATQGDMFVDVQNNCFDLKEPKQQPKSFCLFESSVYSSHKSKKVSLIAGLVGGGVGIMMSVLAVVLVYLCKRKKVQRSPHIGDFTGSSNAGSSVAIPSELLSNARYLSQSMRIGVLSLPHNQIFSLEQLEEATDNFSENSLIGEGVRGKVYKGRLEDGTHVAVKCCCFDPKLDSHDVKAQMELLSKLRHHHVASVIGYCFLDGESRNDRRLLVVTEYVDNGNLRSHISEREEGLSWVRRLAAVIGAAKGVHYLHHGVVPSIFHHDLRMANILMDHNYVPKISDYGLPRPPPHVIAVQSPHVRRSHYRRRYAKETDVYNFGLILLEIVMGRPPTIEKVLGEKPRVLEIARFMEANVCMDLIDSTIMAECGGESLATVIDIALKCLADDMGARPSMEDVLWNLQYAVQVQDTSYADASDDMFDCCSSSPGSVRMKKDIIIRHSSPMTKTGAFEQKISYSGEHERKLSTEDMTHPPRFNSEFLR